MPGVTISVIESFPAVQGIIMGNSWDATHDSSLPVPAPVCVYLCVPVCAQRAGKSARRQVATATGRRQTGRSGQRQGSCNSNCFAVTVVQGCPEVILQS